MSAATARPRIMGIVNVTPDSFSGDGLLDENYIARAVAQAERMAGDGADILDIGGESSRPGAVPVSAGEEIRRVAPVIAAIRKKLPDIMIAVDTTKAIVAEQALQAGATIINDISALAADPGMADIAARAKAAVVLMHNRAAPQAVSADAVIGAQYDAADYEDIVEEVARDLAMQAKNALTAGIPRDNIILDPGIGFGKTPQQNLELIAHLYHFKTLGFRILMGASRKSFIGHVLGTPVEERLEGTAACVTTCVLQGADILRVHDVRFMSRVVTMATALRDA